MLTEIQRRKCPRCGTEFSHMLGGVIYRPFPRCPSCSFPFTIKTGRLL